MSTHNQSIPVAVGGATSNESDARRETGGETFVEPRPSHTPLIDIHEGPEGLILEADLPGSTEENVSIQLEDNVLILHARVSSPAPQEARALHEEYRVADFDRSFILSDEVERSKITAEYKNGVLRLTLPKAERARTRKIEIKSQG